MAAPLLTRPERIAARLLTGAPGHLYGGVADWGVLLTRYLWARARGRPLG